MARTLRVCSFLGISIIGILSTGCVSSEKYNARNMETAQLKEQLAAAQSDANSSRAAYDSLKQQMAAMRSSRESGDALLGNQVAQVGELTRQVEEWKAKYNEALRNVASAGSSSLPIPLTSELTAFASQNPDLVDFDSSKGLVKFKSDVTFSAGSAELQPSAKAAIDRFAQIVNSPTAAPYDLMIVGHTDSTPVSNPNTKKAGHFDNWYLSAHRAISVAHELRLKSVSPSRLEVAGFAEQRPVDATPTKDGMSRNRRVEVLILPSTGHATVAASPTPAPKTAAKAAAPRLEKDLSKDVPTPTVTTEHEQRPAINK